MMVKTTQCATDGCDNNGVLYRVGVNPEETSIECGGCGTINPLQDTDEEPVGRYVPTQEEQNRVKRDRLLELSDYRMVSDAPWDTTAWGTYRQALRDLPTDPAWPDVDFPTPPE